MVNENTEKNTVFKARNKSVGAIVEVLHWTGGSTQDFFEGFKLTVGILKATGALDIIHGSRFIHVNVGDYVIKSHGQLYGCPKSMFCMTYEHAE